MATAAVAATCGLLIAEPRGGIRGEMSDPREEEYTVFNLETGKVEEELTDLFEKGDHDVSVTEKDGCKAHVFRFGKPEPVLSLRGAYVTAVLGRLQELWEIDITARTSRLVVRFPGAPTIDESLFVKAPSLISKSGRYIGVHSERVEARYDPDGRLRIGQYDRIEFVDLPTGELLAPLRCPLHAIVTPGAFLVGDDHAVLAGCYGLLGGRIGSGEASDIEFDALDERDGITALAYAPTSSLLALAIHLRGPDPLATTAKDEIRLYKIEVSAD